MKINFKDRDFFRELFFSEKPNEAQLENIAEWQENLRSGEFKQGQTYLKKDGLYCCLGIYCETRHMLDLNGRDVQSGSPSIPYIPWFLRETGGSISFWELNDNYGFSFEEIADFIDILIKSFDEHEA
jgi:hypothetical protein